MFVLPSPNWDHNSKSQEKNIWTMLLVFNLSRALEKCWISIDIKKISEQFNVFMKHNDLNKNKLESIIPFLLQFISKTSLKVSQGHENLLFSIPAFSCFII